MARADLKQEACSSTRRPERRRASMADSATQDDQCHPRKIFVGGLAHTTTTQHLREHFLRYGAIVDAVVLRWPDGRSRGFGYVTFADVASASAALKDLHKVGGCEVDVKRAVPGTNKLFVGGLPQNTPAAEMRKHFEAFGVVSDAVIMIDPATNRSRGFGFVCFQPGQEGAAAVAAALEQYQNHRIRGKWIEVKSAAPPHKLAAKEEQEVAEPASSCAKPRARAEVPARLQTPPGLPQPAQQLGHGEPQKICLSAVPGLCAAPGLELSATPSQYAPQGGCMEPEGPQRRQIGQPHTTLLLPWNWASASNLGMTAPFMAPRGKMNAGSDPLKVPVPGGMGAWGSSSGHGEGYMSGSQELQRSLEQLLRLQSKDVDAIKVEGKADPVARSPSDWASLIFEEHESLSKMER